MRLLLLVSALLCTSISIAQTFIDLEVQQVRFQQTCILGTAPEIAIKYTNNGTDVVTPSEICISLFKGADLLSIFCDSLSGTDFGVSSTYSYLADTVLSEPGSYSVEVQLNVSGDINPSNNSGSKSINEVNSLFFSGGDNFDSYSDGENSFAPPLTNSGIDQLEWQVQFGNTPSIETGPDADVSGSGGYIYMETSTPAISGDAAILETACMDIPSGGTSLVGFSYHMYGSSIEFLRFEAVGNDTTIVLLQLDGQQQTSGAAAWRDTIIDVSILNGQTARFRWTGSAVEDLSGFVFNGDIALDEIYFSSSNGIDGAISSINLEETSNCLRSSTEPISVSLSNPGLSIIDTLSACYMVEGPTGTFIECDTADGLGMVPLFGTADYTFQNTADLSLAGTYTITAYLTNPDDNALNDTVVLTFTSGSEISLPVVQDFDMLIDGATEFGDQLSNSMFADYNWQVGSGLTSSFDTGPSGDENGTGKYVFTESSTPVLDGDLFILQTGCIDLNTAANPQLLFSHHMFGSSIDYLSVDVETAAGDVNILYLDGEQLGASTDPWVFENLPLADFADENCAHKMDSISQT